MLTLPIKKKWFDMIKDGIKKEEYPFQSDGKRNYDGLVEWVEEQASFGITYKLFNKDKRGISHNLWQEFSFFEGVKFKIIGNKFDEVKE